jgi:hypothetical protein
MSRRDRSPSSFPSIFISVQFQGDTMIRSISIASLASLALSSAAAAALEEGHLDIWVTASGGQLVTGGWDHDSGVVVNPSQRVFEGELGLDPLFPFSGDEPGIGSNLVGTTVSLNLSSTLGAWNGSGFVPSTSALTASYGGQSASTGAGGSFSFLVTQGLDLHPEFAMSGPGGSDPANGIYLATLDFGASGLTASAPLWVVLNLGMSEAEHEAAVEWAEANLVPAPGALAAAALAWVTGARSRTRRR